MSRIFDILYVVTLIVAAPWLLWRAMCRGRNRRGWGQKLLGLVPQRTSEGPCVWLHAVSVGEVNLLVPVIERLRQRRPELAFVISTTTETGFDLASAKYSDHTVFFCPFDFSWAIRRALNRLRPSLIVLAELEVWPNQISIAAEEGVPVVVVNGRLSESSFRGYRRLRWLLRPVFQKLTLVAASNQQYAERFVAMGTDHDRVTVTGSIKFDGISTDRKSEHTRSLSDVAGLRPDDFVIVAGSTQPEENRLIARAYQALKREHANLRLVLVPRHPETCGAVEASIRRLGLQVRRRSQVADVAETSGDDAIMLVDVIGELSAWWGCANAAFVGGSMGGVIGGNRGGQNMIEPAAYGAPVCFGPDTRNFRDVVSQLLAIDAATVVADEVEMLAFFQKVVADPRWARDVGRRSQEFVLQHAGASDCTVDWLLPVMENERTRAA